jgi:hypothetical protein
MMGRRIPRTPTHSAQTPTSLPRPVSGAIRRRVIRIWAAENVPKWESSELLLALKICKKRLSSRVKLRLRLPGSIGSSGGAAGRETVRGSRGSEEGALRLYELLLLLLLRAAVGEGRVKLCVPCCDFIDISLAEDRLLEVWCVVKLGLRIWLVK